MRNRPVRKLARGPAGRQLADFEKGVRFRCGRLYFCLDRLFSNARKMTGCPCRGSNESAVYTDKTIYVPYAEDAILKPLLQS